MTNVTVVDQNNKMLKTQIISDSQSVLQVLEKMDLKSETWILSDLRTKKSIQDYFLKTYGYYPEEAVLRASDLWKKILFRAHPSIQILSHQALLVHIRFFIKRYSEELQIPLGSEPTLLKWMNDFAPLYFHPEGISKVEEFWSEFPDESLNWKNWWFRARAAFSYFESQQLLISQWIPSYLQNENKIEKYWSRPLVIDLGGQFSSVEAGLFQNLAKSQDVLILRPQLDEKSQFDNLLRPYEELQGFSQIQSSLKNTNKVETDLKVIRLSSTLSSFQSAVSQIRQWIESGVKPSEIALVMPDVEETWPCLRFYLDSEGIPFARETKISLQSLPEVQAYLARLRSIGRNLSSRDLELSLFTGNEKTEIQFEKFVSLFTHLYEESDYSRHQLALEVIQQEFNPLNPITADEFLIRMIQVWNTQEIPYWLESLLKQILAQFQTPLLVPWSEWVLLTEGLISSTESTESIGHPDGIVITSLAATHFLKADYLILLEMTEENLKNSGRRGLPSSAAQLISKQLGFWLQDPDTSHLEYELAWLLQKKTKQTRFYFSEVSLSGELQTACSTWISWAQRLKKIDGTQVFPTVVDAKMIKDINRLNIRFQQDINKVPLENLKSINVQKLSPSAIESFLNCPFIYYARQSVGLKVYPELNLEQDPRDKGQIIHKIFEKVLNHDSRGFDEIVDSAVEELKLVIDPALWPVMKKKFVQLLNRFVEFEKNWNTKFNQTEKHHLEVKWKGQLEGISISGQIDRIDQSKMGHLIILDYKNSKSQLKGAHQWLEARNIQMLFYVWALQQNWVADIQGEVVAALYYVVKDFDRTIGLESNEAIEGFYQPSSKKKQKLDQNQLMQDFEIYLKETIKRIQSGEINPAPFKEETCERCDWRKVCRAQHLS